MAHAESASTEPVRFETHPDRYRNVLLDFPAEYGGNVARIRLDIKEDAGLREGYPLKLNSYDLGVDIEIADALMRIRFEHPEVKAILVSSAKDRIFCSGANIYMLGSSTHAFKVNFCKFTNETRLYLEEMSEHSHVPSLAALNGTASGGGYELAIACDEIVLQEDGSSAISFPEAPLLGVLPGTGGLTRLVDKRKIRRDLADVFSTLAEGVRGKRAVEWKLVDEAPPKAKFEACVKARLDAMIAKTKRAPFKAITLPELGAKYTNKLVEYKYVKLEMDDVTRVATLTVSAPTSKEPTTPDELAKIGAESWCIRAFREIDDALLNLRFNHPLIGVVGVKTIGDQDAVLAVDRMLAANANDGLVREVVSLQKRVLKRFDLTAKSFFSLAEPGSCFAGVLLEFALASDRFYMKEDDDQSTHVQLSPMNDGRLPMSNGLSRLGSRFLREPEQAKRVLEIQGKMSTPDAMKHGLVTFAPDDLDWDDEVRIAFEERASMSPDAMTGMEASLRFGGPETMETKIFARLSAWQNWIFQRPNAVGERGALTLYGKPERPEFDYRRT
jgi:benzoyl-CoA-dihydrodiol lyase